MTELEGGAPAVHADARERWLAARRELVTASDVAAILGYDPRRGPLAVYAEKIGALAPLADNDWLAFGRDVEGAIAKGYSRKTGRPAEDLGGFEIARHPDIPWLGATLDRMTAGSEELPAPADGRGPLQLKAVGGRSVWEWRDREPTHYVIQVQIEIAVTRSNWGCLAPMFNGLAIEARDQIRNAHFLDLALPRLDAFRLRVLRREPPEDVDELPSTGAALKSLYPTDSGATVILDGDALEKANRLDVLKDLIHDSTEELKEIEHAIRRRMESATFGALPDGTFLTAKTTSVKGRTQVVKPYTFRALDRFRPRVHSRRRES